jgi:hypothetical protein
MNPTPTDQTPEADKLTAEEIKRLIIVNGSIVFGEFAEGEGFEDFAEQMGIKIANGEKV